MGKVVALIPARGGSKRIPGKNTKLLQGHPLLAYSIASALESGVVHRVLCSTDNSAIADIARSYGAEVPGLRPASLATDGAHDIGFVRPPNPLRRGASIATALATLKATSWADSVRALRPVSEHPGKMWRVDEFGEAVTYLDQGGPYNGPTQDLEKLYVQSSALEIVRTRAVVANDSISGARVLALELPGYEGFDVNAELDWIVMERLVEDNPDLLPRPERANC